MDRLNFFNTISGIEYPEMLVEFYDQFLALKDLMIEYTSIMVDHKTSNSITFVTTYKDSTSKDKVLSRLQVGSIIIYGRPISVVIDTLTDTQIVFTLQ